MLRRWIIRGLTLTLLTLCVVAWVGSYWRCVSVNHWRNKTDVDVSIIAHGRLLLHSAEFKTITTPTARWSVGNLDAGRNDLKIFDRYSTFSFGGFALLYGDPDRTINRLRGVSIPLWFPTLLSGMLLWFVWRKTKAKPKGFPVETTATAK